MKRWGFWDWVTYSCVGVAAIALAVDQAIKGSPRLVGQFSALLDVPAWSYLPLILMVISACVMLLKQLNVLGGEVSVAEEAAQPDSSEASDFLATRVRLQFFGDQRIPHEISSENVAVWFTYFSNSLSIQPLGEDGKPAPGGMAMPPNWVIFLALDRPSNFRQVLVSFSNQEAMPIVDIHMANARVIAISTRGLIPAGVLTVEVKS